MPLGDFSSLQGTLLGTMTQGQEAGPMGANMGEMGGMFGQGQATATEPPVKWKVESGEQGGEPKVSAELSLSQAQGMMSKMKYLEQALAAMTQEANRLQQQEQRARQNPLINVLTNISGQLAQDPRLPPVVSALGRSSLSLNPPPDLVAGRRMDLLETMAGLDVARARTEETSQAHIQTELDRRERLAETKRSHLETEKERVDKEETAKVTRALASADNLAKTSGGNALGAKEFIAHMQAAGVKDQLKINDAWIDHVAHAQAIKEGLAEKRQEKLEFAALMQAPKRQDREEAEKAIEIAAQALAPMNKESLNTMSAVSGMFGANRLKVFARARELNPNFNTAQLGRMMDMEKSFTVGKDGQGLQSFDTFLQHAGEVEKTIKNISQSRSPALNKPMSWWRKNLSGSPEFKAFEVSLEPVGKEFESFLLNQRALYVDDRKQIQVLMNENSSPAQIGAALKQMAKTAKDRYSAMNQRYKRQMGNDIEDPFSPQAHEAAKRIGISLPVSESSSDPMGILK